MASSRPEKTVIPVLEIHHHAVTPPLANLPVVQHAILRAATAARILVNSHRQLPYVDLL